MRYSREIWIYVKNYLDVTDSNKHPRDQMSYYSTKTIYNIQEKPVLNIKTRKIKKMKVALFVMEDYNYQTRFSDSKQKKGRCIHKEISRSITGVNQVLAWLNKTLRKYYYLQGLEEDDMLSVFSKDPRYRISQTCNNMVHSAHKSDIPRRPTSNLFWVWADIALILI